MDTLDQTQKPLIKQALPNATTVLVLGILSIVFCWCWGIVGITMSVVALVLAAKAQKVYMAEPERWKDIKNLQAGRITAIIGLVFSLLFLVFMIIGLVLSENHIGYEFWENFNVDDWY